MSYNDNFEETGNARKKLIISLVVCCVLQILLTFFWQFQYQGTDIRREVYSLFSIFSVLMISGVFVLYSSMEILDSMLRTATLKLSLQYFAGALVFILLQFFVFFYGYKAYAHIPNIGALIFFFIFGMFFHIKLILRLSK